MAEKSGDGASGINYKEICPICGNERTEKCRDVEDLYICPNNKECGNNTYEDYKEGKEFVRKGCTGLLCGNVGMGPFLGNNILIASYGLAQEGPKAAGLYKLVKDACIEEIKTLNVAIVAAFKTKGKMSADKLAQQSAGLEADASNTESEMEGGKLHGYDSHPLYAESKSIQAHHLICSEGMRNDRWRAICKMTGYNINCQRNGVYLPSDMKLACYKEIQCHKGPHSGGRGVGGKSYINGVKKELDEIIDGIKENIEQCEGDENQAIIDQLNGLSLRLLDYISSFTWTIASDSLNYQRGHIGCANCEDITKKRETLKDKLTDVLKKDLRKQKISISLNQIDSIEDVTGDNIDDFLALVYCTERKEHPTELVHQDHLINCANYVNGRIQGYTLEIGH